MHRNLIWYVWHVFHHRIRFEPSWSFQVQCPSVSYYHYLIYPLLSNSPCVNYGCWHLSFLPHCLYCIAVMQPTHARICLTSFSWFDHDFDCYQWSIEICSYLEFIPQMAVRESSHRYKWSSHRMINKTEIYMDLRLLRKCCYSGGHQSKWEYIA